ncbi:hypothetical protein ACFOY2_46205 [Nonomuraea purpurea]|uniref:Uncharacterized protein n=1 Tax=Nonomuraea purpurea TaxID=1849276 RepID=A0ABV8GL57_9ACTN
MSRRGGDGCLVLLMQAATLAALIWSGTTTDITALSFLCWTLAGSVILGLILLAAD